MKIGALAIVHGVTRIANPVHGFATGAELGNDGFGRMPPTQATQLGIFPMRRGVGDVDIQKPR